MEFDYFAYLRDAGVQKGELLDVSSDMMNVMLLCRRAGITFDPNHLLDALQEAVGPEGTLMIRAFSWDFCKGLPFDVRTSKSRVGILGDVAMERAEFLRTRHPLYSWMVWGRFQQELCALDQINAFGSGTPFEFLALHEGRQLRIGHTHVPGYTQMHHIEKLVDVPYRYEKYFDGDYTDGDGQTERRRYTMFVRRLDLDACVRDKWSLMEAKWRDQGILQEGEYGGIEWARLLLREAGEIEFRDLTENYGRNSYTVNGVPGFEDVTRDGEFEHQYTGDLQE